MKKLTLVLTAVAFAANFALPTLAATKSTAPTGTHKMTKPAVTSTTTKTTKSVKTMKPATKTTVTKKMHKKTAVKMHKKAHAQKAGAGPSKSYKKYQKKSTGKQCPAMPGQTY